MGLKDFTVYDVFRRNAGFFQNKPAVVFEERKITFGELLAMVDRAAGWFAQAGIKKGDRVAVLSKNCPEFLVLAGAIASSGAILVPINFRLSVEEIGYNLENTKPMAVFVDPEYHETISSIKAGYPEVKTWVSMNASVNNGFTPFSALLECGPAPAADVSGDDPFVIIHTAAVQGKPRGAVLSHGNMIYGGLQSMAAIGLSHSDVYLNILPLFHIGGLIAAFTTMHAGGVNLIVPKYDPVECGKFIDKKQVTIIGDFPPILGQLLDARDAGHCTLASLKNVYGLERPETIKRFEDLGTGNFWMIYGQTETMGITCLARNADKPGSAGRPGLLSDVMIADEFDRPVATGKVGEILVRGPLVFLGYWGEEELTALTFREGWHHTGDLGRLDAEGFLWFAGRKAEKELIKPGGENVYPIEVEKVVLEHPDVLEVSVIGVPDPKFGEGIKAVCALKPGVKLMKQELIDFVAARIARYKKPNYVEFVESLPKKEDGSIDRSKVKELYG
ncbi:MAG: AMP-binding protein [Syntrophales bacterium]|jgi:long-chain acyl-CoA synthetase|nr:AMP-binding protein [Syntrophales bacterium]